MLEQEILDLIHIPIEQLTKLVGERVQYCTNIAECKNESNYFIVNNNDATIRPMKNGKSGYIIPHSLGLCKRPKDVTFYINKNDYSECQNESNYFIVDKNVATIRLIKNDKSGYIVPHSLELGKRPKGAVFYINKDIYKDVKNQKALIDKKKNRPRLGNPAGWDKINKNKDYDRYFHRGHIITYSLGGDKEIHGQAYKALKSLFTQTAWSNMGKDVKKKGFDNKFSQWHFEEKIVDELEQSSVCIASRPIYRNKADKIPIGIHLQAVTEEDSLFNVFLPNIDPDIKIDYKNCTFKLNR